MQLGGVPLDAKGSAALRQGVVYLTEDRGDSLFYRFRPNAYGNLRSGGVQVGWIDTPLVHLVRRPDVPVELVRRAVEAGFTPRSFLMAPRWLAGRQLAVDRLGGLRRRRGDRGDD